MITRSGRWHESQFEGRRRAVFTRVATLRITYIRRKKLSAQIPYPAAKREFAACFAKGRYQSVVQDLKKAELEKCNARYASISDSKSPRKGYFIHEEVDTGEHIE